MKFFLQEILVFVSAGLWAGAFIQQAEAAKRAGRSPTEGAGSADDAAEEDPELVKYRQMFLERRREHMPALQSLFESYDYDKQHKMVSMLLEKMEEMLLQSKAFLTEQQFQLGATFPTEQTTRDTISLILENVAFVGDISLRLPDVMHKILKKKKAWKSILQWAFEFVRETGFYDDTHQMLLHLASQELKFIERQPDFVNPYSRGGAMPEMFEMPSEKSKKKEKKPKKRGPRVTRSEL